MLSIFKIQNSKQALSYFEQDNYYAKGEGLNDSLWHGKGAARLGLSGQIKPKELLGVLEGRFDNQKLGKGKEHAPGWDLTFSAPKSVSLLTEVLGDSELREAHHKAVKTALDYLEQHATMTRVTHGKKTLKKRSDNLTIAAITHDTSRELDPQLHTHCLVMNGTHAAGKWRSLESDKFYKMKMEAGQLYRNALAKHAAELGYSVATRTDKKGRVLIDIDGIDQSLLASMSKRRQHIEKWLETYGRTKSAQESEKAALNTRQSKTSVDRDSLKRYWQDEVKKHGLDDFNRLKQPQHEVKKEPVKSVLRHSVTALSDHEMSFTDRAIVQKAVQLFPGQYHHNELSKGISELEKEGFLLRTPKTVFKVYDPSDTAYTTPKNKRLETDLIKTLYRNMNSVGAIASVNRVEKSLKKIEATLPYQYSHDQVNAVKLALTSKDRFNAFNGVPGSGKTTVLSALKTIANEAGYEVRGFAPTHTAANEMGRELGIETHTLDYMLTKRLKKVKDKELWVIDESSFSSVKKLKTLMNRAEKDNINLLFVGDTRQLQSIEAGQAFEQLQRLGMKTAELTTINRQRDTRLRQAVEAMTNEDVDRAMDLIKQDVVEISASDDRINEVVKLWEGLSPAERRETLLLAPSNNERKALNDAIRASMKQDAKLGDTDQGVSVFDTVFMDRVSRRLARNYTVGQVLRFNKEYKATGKKLDNSISKNEYFSIVGIDDATNNLILKSQNNDREIRFNPGRRATRQGATTVFETRQVDLAEGDLIRWLDNANDLGIKNNVEFTVKKLTKDSVDLVDSKGAVKTLDLKSFTHRHFTHNYARTVFSSQGMTTKRVIALADSKQLNLQNQKSFLVAISREKESLTLVTDNFDNLRKAIKTRTGEKTRALSLSEEATLKADLLNITQEAPTKKKKSRFSLRL